MYCRRGNRVYQMNQFDFFEETPNYPPRNLPDCPHGVYVKRIRPNLFVSGGVFIKCFDPDPGFPEEISNYIQLGSNPHLPKYYGYYQTPSGICMLIEYLPQARTFGDLTGTAPTFWLEMVHQSFNTLDYIHSRGLTHGDLNAENLLWVSPGKFYLIDFEHMSPVTQRNLQKETGNLIFHLWTVLNGLPSAETIEGVEEAYFYPLIDEIKEARGKYQSPQIQEGIDLLLERFYETSR